MSETECDMTRGVYRRLYAGALKGRRINAVSPLAELAFWRLHMVADDFGVFEADPELVRVQAFPRRSAFTVKQVAGWIEELRAGELVRLAEVNRELYGEIAGFLELQPAPKNGRRIRRFPPLPMVPFGESGGIPGNPGESGGTTCSDTHTHTHTHTHTEADTETNTQPTGAAGAAGVVGLALPFESEAFKAAWADFRKHRQEIKHPLKETGTKSLLKQLEAMGEVEAIAAIERSIAAGWQGVFPDKSGKPTKTSKRAGEYAETPLL
jgi:hypothetical protein